MYSSWTRKIITVMMSIFPKIIQSQLNANQNLCRIFCRNRQAQSTYLSERKRNQNSKNNVVLEGLMPLDFQIYYKARIDKSVWYKRKDIQINRTKQNPETVYGQFIFNKGAKAVQ